MPRSWIGLCLSVLSTLLKSSNAGTTSSHMSTRKFRTTTHPISVENRSSRRRHQLEQSWHPRRPPCQDYGRQALLDSTNTTNTHVMPRLLPNSERSTMMHQTQVPTRHRADRSHTLVCVSSRIHNSKEMKQI
ncbi:hypothetical protein F4804DRAFT_65646 [Jackrogersella minutella]|nr:hypothetical protein F4804DRAFT_65646 [Jackrogersella minutella]